MRGFGTTEGAEVLFVECAMGVFGGGAFGFEATDFELGDDGAMVEAEAGELGGGIEFAVGVADLAEDASVVAEFFVGFEEGVFGDLLQPCVAARGEFFDMRFEAGDFGFEFGDADFEFGVGHPGTPFDILVLV